MMIRANVHIVKAICSSSQIILHKLKFSIRVLSAQNVPCNQDKIQTKWSFHREICPKSGVRMTNSVDPYKTAPLGSGSALSV